MSTRVCTLFLLLSIACASAPAKPVPPPAPVPPVSVPHPATFNVHVFNGDPALDHKVAGATVTIANGYACPSYTTDGAGNGACDMTLGIRPGIDPLEQTFDVWVSAAGFQPYQGTAVATADAIVDVDVSLTPAHVDPSHIPLSDLARIRGAMWLTPLAGLPPKDRIAFAFYPFYGPEDRARMISAYTAKGYTHAVSGPIAGTDCYHGLWPCHDTRFPAAMPEDGVPSQAQFDAYLDGLQELWDGHLIPVCFIKPDGWERRLDLLDQLDALYAQPRAQALCRVVVYPGWEPSGDKYGWSNAIYVAMVERGARVFPDALRLLHTVVELDAPTGQNDDLIGMTNGLAWRNVAHYIHGWLAQYGGYALSGNCTPTETFKKDFGEALADQIRRFRTGASGWPTGSAWGSSTPLSVYAGEYASYVGLWQSCDEAASIELGNIAIAAGSAGYLDGGSAEVPAR